MCIRDRPDTDTRQKEAKAAALQQWQNTLDHLANTPPVGRVNIRVSSKIDRWKNTHDDIEVRAGDTILIPKPVSYTHLDVYKRQLYDMYIQASPRVPTLRRFGLDVFENGTRDSQLIPCLLYTSRCV